VTFDYIALWHFTTLLSSVRKDIKSLILSFGSQVPKYLTIIPFKVYDVFYDSIYLPIDIKKKLLSYYYTIIEKYCQSLIQNR